MSVTVFLGPTLPVVAARAELDAIYRPPVAQGDVLRAALGGARVIAIVDGYFERVPAVWHKEILWAMTQGVHVLGASSMGALRAAELHVFGMVGVGRVFERFQSGELDADDEVAIAHAAAEDDYRTLSEALVNMRATLEAAERDAVVSGGTRARLEQLAKDTFYAERSYPGLLARGAREGLPAAELRALRGWLPRGRVDQKRLDALALLRTIRETLLPAVAPLRVRYTFEHTDAWEAVLRQCGAGTDDERRHS